MSFVVFTSDKYVSLVEGFSYLFNKFWDDTQHVHVLGFDAPQFELPSNFTFISAGKQSDFPDKAFCGPFKKILEELPCTTLTYFLEDTYIVGHVQKDIYAEAKKLVLDRAAHKVELFWGASNHYITSKAYNTTFRAFHDEVDYRCNLAPSIVDKEYFLSFFEDHYGVHEFEVANMGKARSDGKNILLSWRSPICRWFNLIRHGKFNTTNWNEGLDSPKGIYGWNKYQVFSPEMQEYISQYENWSVDD